MTATVPTAQRSTTAAVLGFLAGAATALPALAVAPWMLVGLMAGFSGGEMTSVEAGQVDWGLVATSSALLLLCIGVPVLVGWGTYRLLDLLVGRARRRQARPATSSAASRRVPV